MVKSGIVVSVNKADKSGVIECFESKQEYFFSVDDCCEGELPAVWTHVTFVRDTDYKTTKVAMLIKRSNVSLKVA